MDLEKRIEEKFNKIDIGLKNFSAYIIKNGELSKFVLKEIKADRGRIIKEIEKIDFYGWNKETQIMIKNKVLTLIKK